MTLVLSCLPLRFAICHRGLPICRCDLHSGGVLLRGPRKTVAAGRTTRGDRYRARRAWVWTCPRQIVFAGVWGFPLSFRSRVLTRGGWWVKSCERSAGVRTDFTVRPTFAPLRTYRVARDGGQRDPSHSLHRAGTGPHAGFSTGSC